MNIGRYATVGVMLASLLATPALAEETATTTNTNQPAAVVKPVLDLACVQSAVEKRDNAIIAAVDTYSTHVKTALTTRRDALKAAWGMADRVERRKAIRAAWDAFRGTWRKEKRALTDARRAAWKQFRADAKACKATGASGVSLENGGEGADASL
ncbi:hypothetical protein EPN90_00995 [Patescibacteria group bacterium]|nr:MAG: hypothetical protein EPN90_00995 [Patescibacteria group bacterium]